MRVIRWKRVRSWAVGLASGALVVGFTVPAVAPAAPAAAAPSHPHIDCANSNRFLCTEVANSSKVFGWYVGHDEPSVLFDSNQPGSGNHMVYQGVLPKEPPPSNVPGQRSYDFNLYAAFWYGMAMCDTQSYPETVKTCAPDSNTNVTRPGSPYHAGTAYMELQFYPPGYVQQWNGFSCSPTQWCVALTIDSLSINAVTGQQLNSTCASQVGLEYVNFAYLTHNGIPQGPPNPVDFSPTASGTPNPQKVLYLNQGDHYAVALHDTPQGLRAVVVDTTTGQSGSMTASAANGFGQVKFAPNGTSCQNIPYNFHPMYSTSSPATTVPWAAATYNVAFDTEVGHFDYCSDVNAAGVCVGTEGAGANTEPADPNVDDVGCFPPGASSLVQVGGCLGNNLGFDGTSYLPDWPNGNQNVTPTPTEFTSPLTGPHYTNNYPDVRFNTDLPAIESQIGTCNSSTGAGCSRIPPTDDNGAPAAFYPYYTIGRGLGGCTWSPGQDVPGYSVADFGRNYQYGQLLKVAYPGPNGTVSYQYNDYQGNLHTNPCPARVDRGRGRGRGMPGLALGTTS